MKYRNNQINEGKQIGILGGTFDPVHLGHIALAKSALEKSDLDEVWLLPNPIPPHKALSNNSASVEDRLAMLNLAAEDTEGLTVSEIEIRSGRENYTYQTLEALDAAFPNDTFHFIIGADSLFMLESWKCPERLLPGHSFLAAVRDEHNEDDVKEQIRYLNQKYGSRIAFVRMKAVDISSTEIRQRAKDGESLSGLVPRKVEEYIHDNHLYLTEAVV